MSTDPQIKAEMILDDGMADIQASLDEIFNESGSASAGRSGALLGADNLRKSFFYRSWKPKASRNASLTVVRYTDSGTMEVVPDEENGLIEHRFVLTESMMQRSENIAVMQTFGEDPDLLLTFGANPQMWSFQGVLRNERRLNQPIVVIQEDGSRTVEFAGDGDWTNGFVEAYNTNLRASVLVRRGYFLHLALGDLDVFGYITSLNVMEHGQNDIMSTFRMDFFVRQVIMPGHTLGSSFTSVLDSGAQ
jgi:hypothetical protein